MRRLFPGLAAAAVLLGGCVTAKVDYSLAGVRAAPGARFASMPVTLKIIDRRYADKKSVASFAHKQGTYNKGIEFPAGLSDYSEIFGTATAHGKQSPQDATRYYIAPDRLYWTPSGPMESLGEKLAEHLMGARVFASVAVDPPSTMAAAVPKGRGNVLVVTINRLLALKERRPGFDTFGFFGISALASSGEILMLAAEWTLLDGSGRELARGETAAEEKREGNCFRAKNKPFAMTNDAAKRLGEAMVRDLR